MDMKEAMKARHMVRKYTDRTIPVDIADKLNERVRMNNELHGLSIRLMTNDKTAVPGVIRLILAKGVNNFFIMAGPDGADELCGYCGADLMLYAQTLGLNTWWVGGTYNRKGAQQKTEGAKPVGMFDAALKRGIHCLTYDGPGQGYALRFQDMKFRPDWEKVMGPVLDFAESIACVDMNRVACMGFSFGGFLMPRVAAYDKRIKLIITDPGNISWGKGIGERLSMIQKMPKVVRPKFMQVMLEDYAWKHGVSEDAVVDELNKYDNTGILDKVKCEVLVLDGTAEMTFGAAKELYDSLPNAKAKDYILFDDNSTAQCHTQMGGYATGAEIIMDWLEDHI